MANSAVAGKRQETGYTLDPEALMPNVSQGQMRVLLRIYGKNGVGHSFAIQTKDGKLLGADGKELVLKEGSYAKNYNWHQLYGRGQKIDIYNPKLWWMEEGTLAGKVRAQYADLKWGGSLQEGDQLLVYQLREEGHVVETGVARQHGNKIFRNDGTQVEGEFYKLYIDEKLHGVIMEGKFNPADAGLKKKWVPPIMDELWERPEQGTQGVGMLGRSVNITFYYVPYYEEPRFGGSLKRVKEAGALNGTYRDGNGVYWNYNLKTGEFDRIDKPRTNTGDEPKKDFTLSVPPEWNGKHILIVQNGKVLVDGMGEDWGTVFTAGSGKVDVFTGEGEEAYKYGLRKYNGYGIVYAFDTKEEKEAYKKRLQTAAI